MCEGIRLMVGRPHGPHMLNLWGTPGGMLIHGKVGIERFGCDPHVCKILSSLSDHYSPSVSGP